MLLSVLYSRYKASYSYTEFLIAIQEGEIDKVLDRLSCVESKYRFPEIIAQIASNVNCVLWMVTSNGYLAIFNRLLEKNIDGSYEFPAVVAEITADGNYVLRSAAEKGHLTIINRLFAKNIDGSYEFPAIVAAITTDDNYAFRVAAQNGHLSVVNRLLAKTPDGSYEFPSVGADIVKAFNAAANNTKPTIAVFKLIKHLLTPDTFNEAEFVLLKSAFNSLSSEKQNLIADNILNIERSSQEANDALNQYLVSDVIILVQDYFDRDVETNIKGHSSRLFTLLFSDRFDMQNKEAVSNESSISKLYQHKKIKH